MATAIPSTEVLHLVKEILPGASAIIDEHSSITLMLAEGPFPVGMMIFRDTNTDLIMGSAVDLGIGPQNIHTVEELRWFLEACRDKFVKNLTAMLVKVLGPVRVLPKDEELDRMRPADFCVQMLKQSHTDMTMAEILNGYPHVAAHRRATRSAGS